MAVGIAAVIAIAALVIFKSVDSANKIGTEVKNLGIISAAVTNLYSTSPSYNGLTKAQLLTSSGLPDSIKNGTTKMKSAWDPDGIDVVSAPDSNGVTDGAYQINYTNVPQSACVDLASKSYSLFPGGLKVGTTAVTSVATAATACPAGTATFTFHYLSN
jgi:hypothetical protein